jgi:hypothetical protein
VKYAGNPVIRPDIPTDGVAIQTRDAPVWDEKEQVWKLWYIRFGDDGNGAGGSGYARSKDGVAWEKPSLGLVEAGGNRKNNLVTVEGAPEAFVQHVVLDPDAPADRRFKGMIGPNGRQPSVSADGFDLPPSAGGADSQSGRVAPQLGSRHAPVDFHRQARWTLWTFGVPEPEF